MSATATNTILREVRAICGDDNTRERPAGGVYVSPESPEAVAAVLRLANRIGASVGVAGGSTEFSAADLRTDIVLHTSRLTQVEHYDHGDLTVGVGAGTTIAQLSAMVGADNLMFAGDPPLAVRCTVGGLLATAQHGPQRHGHGAVRDYCIGVRFVTGDGRRGKGGGRVVKNVAGYDLMKLLIGSYGTLAVITSASFKLFPAPRQVHSFLAEFSSAREALAFRDRVVRSPLAPMCLELVSPSARKMMRPVVTEDAWVICLRAAGSDSVLARYRRELGSAITREMDGDSERHMWNVVGDFPTEFSSSGAAPVTFHINAPPSQTLSILSCLEASAAAANLHIGIIGRVGIGHLQVTAVGDFASVEITKLVREVRRQHEAAAIKLAGAVRPWPISPGHRAQMQAIKQALDPRNILRGREFA